MQTVPPTLPENGILPRMVRPIPLSGPAAFQAVLPAVSFFFQRKTILWIFSVLAPVPVLPPELLPLSAAAVPPQRMLPQAVPQIPLPFPLPPMQTVRFPPAHRRSVLPPQPGLPPALPASESTVPPSVGTLRFHSILLLPALPLFPQLPVPWRSPASSSSGHPPFPAHPKPGNSRSDTNR